MRKKASDIIVDLVSSLQGAPYPSSINNELYTIWYEHAQIAAQEALHFVERKRAKEGKDTSLDAIVDHAQGKEKK
jgi:divalent metal cation (Fe/Co/Zn/Cd) transporter